VKRGWSKQTTGVGPVWFDNGHWWVVLARLRGDVKEVAAVEILPNGSIVAWFPEKANGDN